MGVKKGQDNFSPWRKERTKKHLSMVDNAVKEASKHKLKFDNENKMASWVASRIGLHRTTIIRSIQYMQPIRDYVYNQAGIGDIDVNENSSQDVMLTKIKAMELELTRKNGEVRRLSKYIEKHSMPMDEEEPTAEYVDVDCERKVSDVCRIVKLIHERVDSHIEIDISARQIRDLSVRGAKRIVASGEMTDVFFDWLEKSSV